MSRALCAREGSNGRDEKFHRQAGKSLARIAVYGFGGFAGFCLHRKFGDGVAVRCRNERRQPFSADHCHEFGCWGVDAVGDLRSAAGESVARAADCNSLGRHCLVGRGSRGHLHRSLLSNARSPLLSLTLLCGFCFASEGSSSARASGRLPCVAGNSTARCRRARLFCTWPTRSSSWGRRSSSCSDRRHGLRCRAAPAWRAWSRSSCCR